MARSSSFFTLRSGSTKSLTFQKFRGTQITKDRVTSVANPQSTSQMLQRYKIPMVAAARSALKGLVDHSFEGTEYGWQSLQKFSSLNLQKNALNVVGYVPKGAMDPGEADFIVSRGSLSALTQAPTTQSISTQGVADGPGMFLFNGWNGDSPVIVCAGATPTENECLQAFNAALLGTDLTRQLSFLLEVSSSSYSWVNGSTSHTAPRHRFRLYRYDNVNTLSDLKAYIDVTPAAATATAATLDCAIVIGDYIRIETKLTNVLADGKANLSLKKANYQLTGSTNSYDFLCGVIEDIDIPTETWRTGVIIKSEKRDTTWARSSNRMRFINPFNVPTSAIDQTYLKSESTSDKFLNNGQETTYIEGNSGSATSTSTAEDDSTDGGEKPQG